MKIKIQKNKILKDKIYDGIVEYRKTLITTVVFMIPIIFILYILNIHHYIFPKLLGNSIIFRLDIYYRYFALIFAFMHFYELYYTKEKPRLADYFLYLFLGMTVVSTIFAYNSDIALFGYPNRYEGMFTLLFYCFLYLNCQKINDTNYVQKMTKIIIFSTFIQFFTVTLQLTGLFSKVIYMYKTGDAIGLTENCNFLGSVMCMLSMITSAAFILKIEKKNIFYLIAFIIGYVTLLLANSTGPFISFIVTLIIFVIYSLIRRVLNIKNLMVTILLITILYPVVLSKNDEITPEIKSHIMYFLDRFQNNEDGTNDESNNSNLTTNQLGHGRVKIWKNVWNLVEGNPLIGYGPDNLGVVYKEFVVDNYKIADKAHNIYLHILVSSGVFALIGYLGFVILDIKDALKSKNFFIICLSFGVVAYSIQGIFNINVNEVTPYFYIILGFMVSLIRENSSKQNNNQHLTVK